MQRASRIIGNIQNAGVAPEDIACAAWARAVGRKLAAHTRAAHLVRARLVVEVEDAVWRGNLMSLTPHILRNLAESLGPGVVGELEFRVMPPRREPARSLSNLAAPLDDADLIGDPVMRNIYKAARDRSRGKRLA